MPSPALARPRALLAAAVALAALAPAGCGDPDAPTCAPACGDRVCGPDPVCGASCGACGPDATCAAATGQCEPTCAPATCAELGAACGAPDDGCGEPLDCGHCPLGAACADGACTAPAWPLRSCETTLRYAAPAGTSQVAVAGEFNGWSATATPLADPDGDGTFTLTLAPSAALRPGARYAYKVVADGAWLLDPASTWRKYDGPCLNSAFEMPACDRGPELRVLSSTLGGPAAPTTFRFTLARASDGAAPASLSATLDGAPLPASAASTDPATAEITLTLPALALGKHRLALRATDTAGRAAAPVDLPFWIEAAPFDWRDMTLYMFVIDRFANGRADNDAPHGAPVLPPADWHGGDLWGALAVIESGYFERLGVNTLWLSPANRQVDGPFIGRDGPELYTAYHGYWPIRAREVDPRFGGDDALRALVDAAHRRGLRVLLDLINNQVHDEHEYVAAHPDWFRGECVCGLDPGCDWSERPLDCLFASYLPDIDWRVAGAEEQFIADALFWIERFDVDGFRIDAVKHVETNSIYNLRARLAERFEQGGARHYLVGETAVTEGVSADYGCDEVYPDGYAWVDAYVGPNALDGQFDFPTHHHVQERLLADELGYDALEAFVARGEARYRDDALHVSFLGTHDSARMASLAARDPARYCTWPTATAPCTALPATPTDPAAFARLTRALTLLFTLPGRPLLYYGDEIALPGGRDPDNRRGMIWTGDLAALALGGTTLSDAQSALRSRVEALGQARHDRRSLRRGRRVVLLAEPDLYVYAFVASAPHELTLVAVNRGGAVTTRAVGALAEPERGAVRTFEALAGEGAAELDGVTVEITVPAGEAVIWAGR